MRRISLALALIGAVTAAGCGQTSTSNGGGNRGVVDGTFTLTIQNGQNGNTSLKINGGYVKSTPAGIDCGGPESGHTTCSFEFPVNQPVLLTATALSGSNFWGFAGDCFTAGNTCSVSSGGVEMYVVARFGVGTPPDAHPNWNPSLVGSSVHSLQVTTLLSSVPPPATAWHCSECHGGGMQGAGLAPACASCHSGGSAVPVAPATLAVGEQCSDCHLNQGKLHQDTYNKFTDGSATGGTILSATIDSVASSAISGTAPQQYIYTVKFSILKNGVAYNGDVTKFGQKTVYLTKFDPVTREFTPSTSCSSSSFKLTTPAGTGKWECKNTGVANPPNNTNLGLINTATDQYFVYAYFAENPTIIAPEGHYNLYDNVASIGRQFNTWTTNYTSYANVTACENCHGRPYSKHGYRQATVAGLNDFVACKACHFDNRAGTDFDWQVLRNEPEVLAELTANGTTSAVWTTGVGLDYAVKYAYTANVMNDTHMSHAMEFPYPQDAANCATCHAGKFGNPQGGGIFADGFFNTEVCKSCHATTAGAPDEEFRAPLLAPGYHEINWTTGKFIHRTAGVIDGQWDCTACHSDAAMDSADGGYPSILPSFPKFYAAGDPKATDGVGPVMSWGATIPLMKDLHSGGFSNEIYADNTGTKWANQVTTTIASATADATGLTITFTVTMTGVPANAKIYPTVVASLYGYGTKDFLIGGHQSQPAPDSKRNLEWAEGSTSNAARFSVTPNATAGNASWTVKANLGLWATQIAGNAIDRLQIGFLPAMGQDPTKKPDNAETTGTPPVANANYNPYVAIGGATASFQLGATSGPLTAATEKVLVDNNKCNACHDRLATTFHNANYGSAGVVGCRLCHTPASGGSHLEMQGRSIDSYVHSIHAFQAFDIGSIDFTDPVAEMEYNHHIGHTFPTFTLLACEACHTSGQDPVDGRKMYDLPLNGESLPAILSASSSPNTYRAISGIPTVVTGPSSKACGGCHRAYLINNDYAAALQGYDAHTKTFGYREPVGGNVPGATISDVWNQVIKNILGE